MAQLIKIVVWVYLLDLISYPLWAWVIMFTVGVDYKNLLQDAIIIREVFCLLRKIFKISLIRFPPHLSVSGIFVGEGIFGIFYYRYARGPSVRMFMLCRFRVEWRIHCREVIRASLKFLNECWQDHQRLILNFTSNIIVL